MNEDRLASAEDDFKQHLLEIGLLPEVSPPLDKGRLPKQREPAPVAGNAVSDLVIRERR